MDLREALKLAAPSGDITRTLINDTQECAHNADSRPWNQFWKRMYVRSAYSMIEGINNFMKQSIYSYHETGIRPLHERFKVLNITPPRLFAESQSESELLLLLEKAVSLKPNGSCHIKDAFTPTDASIRFMFEMHKRVFQTDYTPDFAVKGWSDLKVGLLV
ncbi:MAG: hypothetical protein INR62_08920, partial [Rhodospirillales bacterium]|nr:hypothetical protein [Acetobacter sp.]